MDRTQKILTTVLWGVLVLAMLGVVGTGLLARWRSDTPITDGLPPVRAVTIDQPRPDYEAPEFSLTDQEGRTVTSQSLRGQPYVASFIFTHCAGACPTMTRKMAALQKAVPDPRVKFVSFTCDPERDTPAVLKAYAGANGATGPRWHFLTGTVDQMRDVAAGMKVSVAKGPDGSDQYIHDLRFFLVDAEGRVRGTYSHNDESELKQLAADARDVAAGHGVR